jgi:hypothetical protein
MLTDPLKEVLPFRQIIATINQKIKTTSINIRILPFHIRSDLRARIVANSQPTYCANVLKRLCFTVGRAADTCPRFDLVKPKLDIPGYNCRPYLEPNEHILGDLYLSESYSVIQGASRPSCPQVCNNFAIIKPPIASFGAQS